MPKILGENIDRLCTVEMRRPGSAPRGYVRTLYEAAVAEGGGDPLSYRAAQLLLDRCAPGKTVFVFCNAGVPPYLPFGETDGPLGGASVARAINVATGALPIFISSDGHAVSVIPAAKAIGLQVLPAEMATLRPKWAAVDERYNETVDEDARALALIDTYDPCAMIALECLAPNKDGITCSSMGYPVTNSPAYHNFFRLAARRGIATIGVGDGGNEIGCGRIYDSVRERLSGRPGGLEIAAVATADILIFSAVSNWGGYAIAAMLSFLAQKPNALHSPEQDRRMLDAISFAGAAEGAELSLNPEVDLIEGRVHADLVNALTVMVRNASQELYRPF